MLSGRGEVERPRGNEAWRKQSHPSSKLRQLALVGPGTSRTRDRPSESAAERKRARSPKSLSGFKDGTRHAPLSLHRHVPCWSAVHAGLARARRSNANKQVNE